MRCGQIPTGGADDLRRENIMMIVLGHFLFAAAAAIATSAIIGYFLTKLLLWLLQKVDRSIKLYRGKVPAFSAPRRISSMPTKSKSRRTQRRSRSAGHEPVPALARPGRLAVPRLLAKAAEPSSIGSGSNARTGVGQARRGGVPAANAVGESLLVAQPGL